MFRTVTLPKLAVGDVTIPKLVFHQPRALLSLLLLSLTHHQWVAWIVLGTEYIDDWVVTCRCVVLRP